MPYSSSCAMVSHVCVRYGHFSNIPLEFGLRRNEIRNVCHGSAVLNVSP